MNYHNLNCSKVRWAIFSFFSSTNVETKNVCPIAYNVQGFAMWWHSTLKKFNNPPKLNRITMMKDSTSAAPYCKNPLLAAGVGDLNVVSAFDGMSCGQIALQKRAFR
jgi:hypothetical protein